MSSFLKLFTTGPDRPLIEDPAKVDRLFHAHKKNREVLD